MLLTLFTPALVVLAFPVALFTQNAGDRYVVGLAVVKPPDCPCFVSRVTPESPASAAGIMAGERLLAIDSTDVSALSLAKVLSLLSSDKPSSVALKLWRNGKEYGTVLKREQLSVILARRSMRIVPQGLIVPSDSTELDIERLSQTMSGGSRLVAHPFPAHVPLNNDLYHGGFALLILRDPDQVIATGIENGPASRAGVRQGDLILAVNETTLTGKAPVEIEALFFAENPRSVRLKIDRGGAVRDVEYRLEKVSEILAANQLRLVDKHVVPRELADEDIPCLTGRK